MNVYPFGNPLANRQSSPQVIADALREAIIEGHLAPDEPLRQELLARHFAVSRIPLREALRQLESEGWVAFQTNRGARVSGLSGAAVREIYEIRASLECTALKLAVPNHTAESWQAVGRLLRQSNREPRQPSDVRRNRDFHLALYAPAARPHLLSLIESLHSRGERYLRLKLDIPLQKKHSDAEHGQILEAARAGQLERAVRILEQHLLQTGEMLAGYLSDEPRRAARKKSLRGASR